MERKMKEFDMNYLEKGNNLGLIYYDYHNIISFSLGTWGIRFKVELNRII